MVKQFEKKRRGRAVLGKKTPDRGQTSLEAVLLKALRVRNPTRHVTDPQNEKRLKIA